MNKISCIMLVGIVFLYGVASPAFAVTARSAVKKGNDLYEDKKFDEALTCYDKARERLPESEIVDFNTGSARYQKKDYEKALYSFNKALLTGNPELEAKANYNMGNTKYRLGFPKEEADTESAIKLYQEALNYYTRAIELDKEDEDAQYNHDFVKKRLDMLLQKQKEKQQEKQEQQEEQGDQDKKEQQQSSGGQGQQGEKEQQEKSSKDEEEKDETEKMKEKIREELRKEMEKEGDEGEEGKDQKPQPQQAEPGEQEMSKDEARMLLEGYKEDTMSDLERPKRGRISEVLKDW